MTDTTGTTKATLLALAIGLALSPIAANAKGGPGQGQRASFEELDLNSDGKITQAEMQEHRAARFAAADSNGDGLLSAEELAEAAEARRASRMERMISRFDQNDDGLLSAEELAAEPDRRAARFERIDADGDGAISQAEFEDAPKGRRGRGAHRH